MSWQELLDLGESLGEDLLAERHKQMALNHCATMIYTSGTTGMPKGANIFSGKNCSISESGVDVKIF
jgi:long-subunit acyl-CoA synthetase (AMP-forming)